MSRSLAAANTYDVFLQYSRARDNSGLGNRSRGTRRHIHKLTVTVSNNVTSVFLDGLRPCFDVNIPSWLIIIMLLRAGACSPLNYPLTSARQVYHLTTMVLGQRVGILELWLLTASNVVPLQFRLKILPGLSRFYCDHRAFHFMVHCRSPAPINIDH